MRFKSVCTCAAVRCLSVVGLGVVSGTRPAPGLMRAVANSVVEWRSVKHLEASKIKRRGWEVRSRAVVCDVFPGSLVMIYIRAR